MTVSRSHRRSQHGRFTLKVCFSGASSIVGPAFTFIKNDNHEVEMALNPTLRYHAARRTKERDLRLAGSAAVDEGNGHVGAPLCNASDMANFRDRNYVNLTYQTAF